LLQADKTPTPLYKENKHLTLSGSSSSSDSDSHEKIILEEEVDVTITVIDKLPKISAPVPRKKNTARKENVLEEVDVTMEDKLPEISAPVPQKKNTGRKGNTSLVDVSKEKMTPAEAHVTPKEKQPIITHPVS
jgi:hypothetical protein